MNVINSNSLLHLTTFINTIISEEQLNEIISSTQDCSVLHSLLEIKLHLININKHSPINYEIDFILKRFSIVNADELCYTITVALLVQNNSSQYLLLLQFIQKNLLLSTESLQYLKLLDVALVLCKSKREEGVFKKYVDENHFDVIISKLIRIDSKIINNYCNINVLPKYLNINCASSKRLFKEILKLSIELNSLDAFCAIPQIFIENNNTLLQDDKFWCLLQTGLNNYGIYQKQALYLLKLGLNYCKRHEHFSTPSRIVHWNESSKKQVFLAWHNLLILYEVTREKQLHLIEPIFQLIPAIKILHPSWLSSIFKILLLHPQLAVCTYTLMDVLKSNWYFNNLVFIDIVASVLHTLNKTDFVLDKSVWIHMSKFIENFEYDQFMILLEESANVSWIPSICYRLYSTIFKGKSNFCVPIPLCTRILLNLRKLPHKFIREECLQITTDYIQTMYCQEMDIKEYMELNKILFGDSFHLWIQQDIEKFIPHIQTIIQSWIGNNKRDLEQVETILRMIETLNKEILDNFLYEIFMNNEVSAAIQDRLCVFFCTKNRNVLTYVNNRLLNVVESDDTYLTHLAPLLKTFDSNTILETCTNILFSDKSNKIQIEICLRLVHSLLLNEVIMTNSKFLEEILWKWKKKICNSNTCLCFLQILTKKEIDSETQLLKMIEIFEYILETQDFITIPEVFLHLKSLINACHKVETLLPFLDLCVRKLLELKGSIYFRTGVENFVKSILLNNVIFRGDNKIMYEKCGELLCILFDWIHSGEDIGYSISTNLYQLSQTNSAMAFNFIQIIINILTFGDILRKDQRAEYEICQIISNSSMEKKRKNPNLRKIAIRGEIIKCIQNILTNDQDGKKGDEIAKLLIQKYLKYVNKRCFSNSQVHMVKLRILQTLLLIHNYIQCKNELIDVLLNSLCTESHQLSNKILIIWLLIKLLYDVDNCLELISTKIENTSKIHASTISAFIPVIYHIALLKKNRAFCTQVCKQLLPWTMGPHFNLRLYAQVGIKKLSEVLYQRENKEVYDQFKEMFDGVNGVLDKTEREIEAIDEYIFNVFNPMNDFNKQTIYYIIPHITNVTNDEYENILDILNCPINQSSHLDYLRTVHFKSTKQSSNCASTSIIQKKIIPERNINHIPGELIVVASLVDKVPNLGGLTRTSEVFGVKNLVVNSLSIVKNIEFQNISMSSENWINITEVKVNQLQSFLLSMKEEGYSIIGAEQTSESIKLHHFKFPKKSLLLLGNEKEGIPPNLLSLIDACVEIPQLGVVRSLNVHVAAATFIWEYSKMHLL